MSDQSAAARRPTAPHAAANSRDCLPQSQSAGVPHLPPAPWVGLTRAECLLWALALHRAAVAARPSAGDER